MVAIFLRYVAGHGTQFSWMNKRLPDCTTVFVWKMYTTHARPAGFIDRQEIDRSIATVLVASGGLCARVIPKIVFDIGTWNSGFERGT
jgi:hypothetical protein